MGNRIHTVLGYGLTDVKWKTDDRINPAFWDDRYDDVLDLMKVINTPRFLELEAENNYVHPDHFGIRNFQARVDNMGWYKDDERVSHLYTSKIVHYSGYLSEMKDGGPMVFVDPFNKEWTRFDNILDYYIFSSKEGPIEQTRLITDEVGRPCGIYPNMRYVNQKTGKLVTCSPSDRWRKADQHMAEKYEMDINEWIDDVVPEIPYTIRLFCEATSFFTNPLTVHTLRPMIYTYWC